MAGPTLLTSLHMREVPSPSAIVFDIGSPLDYAASVHQGSQPHDITGTPLAFRWNRLSATPGRRGVVDPWFQGTRVRHPGNKRPRRFLTTPLQQFGRAAGFAVSTSNASRGFLP